MPPLQTLIPTPILPDCQDDGYSSHESESSCESLIIDNSMTSFEALEVRDPADCSRDSIDSWCEPPALLPFKASYVAPGFTMIKIEDNPTNLLYLPYKRLCAE